MTTIGTDDKFEIFKRAYAGLINHPIKSTIGRAILSSFAFKYNGDKTALFFGMTERATCYFFLTDDGIILEYIAGRLNVLNAKCANEKYDIQSDKEVLDNINLMFNQIPYYLLKDSFYLFKDSFLLMDVSELSKDDANLFKLFKRSKSFEMCKYGDYPNFHKVIDNIFVPYFFKRPLSNINSSQLELDMSNLGEYYLVVRNDDSNISKNIDVENRYSEYLDNINDSITTTLQKYDPCISFELKDNIEDNFNIITYDIKPFPIFLLQDSTRTAFYTKGSFFTLENLVNNLGYSTTDNSCNIDEICKLIWKDCDLSPDLDFLYQNDKGLDHIRYSENFIVFGFARAKKIQNYLNDKVKSKFFSDMKKASTRSSKIKILSEEDFISDMRKVYQQIKQKENLKRKCSIEIANNAKESFDLLFNNDCEVI